ncbi:hypothetical protein AJ79_06967 [Helicocarpus griseus UAMH5409]|uniref:Glucose-methanol-choline oxidoreductase N-terminal domain-containing protein n=1 Tax=Helicocarpus griseus UAMH5409 TaxID=1447875 RepID=A0A2B7X819_9EURO|nr:hypothetical protein AJ79_06967 [Helicocarpus griseus UAMH5409]
MFQYLTALSFAALVAGQQVSPPPAEDAIYDYVVIGGGPGGLTVAARLAETASVAVVEAGGFYEVDNGNSSVVPLYSLTGMPFLDTSEQFPPSPLVDWGLLSEVIPTANNRRIHYAQGKTFGGCTAINTMAYHRGTAGSYDRWASMVGDDSYTFTNLQKYFTQSCHLTAPDLEKRNATNTTINYDPEMCDNSEGGPLQVSWNNWVDPTLTWLGKAVEQLGLTVSPEGFSSGTLAGHFAWIPSTIEPAKAIRCSAESSYLQEALPAGDLTAYPNTLAKKVLFDSSSSNRAMGVTVSTNGIEYTLSAAKEVIMSAGVFHSPQLLMVSGIGPKDMLAAHDIPVISDLPGVGQNLWDPISLGIMYTVNTQSGASITANPANWPISLEQYGDAGGPYSSAAGFIAYEKLSEELRSTLSDEALQELDAFPSDWPDLEFVAGSFPGAEGTNTGSITATLIKPFSRGNITIVSNSMNEQPSINLGWFSNPHDEEVAVAAFKRLRQAWDTDAANTVKVGEEAVPGSAVQSDEEILEFLRGSVNQLWHASGTCAMGKSTDENAVVDANAKVFGVEGLRVVDISAFPFALPAHPQASVYMLGEKIAHDIKNGR